MRPFKKRKSPEEEEKFLMNLFSKYIGKKIDTSLLRSRFNELFDIFYSSLLAVLLVVVFLSLSGCAMTGGPNIKTINKNPLFLTANDHNDFGRILLHGEKIQHEIPIKLPANAPSILSDYKSNFSPTGVKRQNYPNNPSGHDGIDISVPIGYPVLAVADGIVVKSYTSSIGGNMIVIEHGIDKNGFIVGTSYLHNDENLVLEGDPVKRGQYIARSGHTGSFRGGVPHLHFEVFRVKNRNDIEPFCDGYWWSHPDNPHKYWMDGRGKITCFDRNTNYVNDNLKFVYPVLCK